MSCSSSSRCHGGNFGMGKKPCCVSTTPSGTPVPPEPLAYAYATLIPATAITINQNPVSVVFDSVNPYPSFNIIPPSGLSSLDEFVIGSTGAYQYDYRVLARIIDPQDSPPIIFAVFVNDVEVPGSRNESDNQNLLAPPTATYAVTGHGTWTFSATDSVQLRNVGPRVQVDPTMFTAVSFRLNQVEIL